MVNLLSAEATGAVPAADGALVDARAAAAAGLKNLAFEEKLQDQIAARGASALVELCSTTDDISSAQVAADGHDEAASSLRRAIAGAIWAIVMNNPTNQTLFAQKDAVAPLVAMCSTHLPSTYVQHRYESFADESAAVAQLQAEEHGVERNAEEQANAAGALWELAKDVDNREIIAAAGGLLALLKLALKGNKRVSRTAGQALKVLSISGANAAEIQRLKEQLKRQAAAKGASRGSIFGGRTDMTALRAKATSDRWPVGSKGT